MLRQSARKKKRLIVVLLWLNRLLESMQSDFGYEWSTVQDQTLVIVFE